ncbi:MAG: hypothetical protein PHF00_06210, partial [Elusimicrobia bacterium]|nr:hypothetical protein [Elusimicrobiota bacterium]
AFPESKDAVDELIPVKDFGSWLRNFRVRKGLQQVELAKLLGIVQGQRLGLRAKPDEAPKSSSQEAAEGL